MLYPIKPASSEILISMSQNKVFLEGGKTKSNQNQLSSEKRMRRNKKKGTAIERRR